MPERLTRADSGEWLIETETSRYLISLPADGPERWCRIPGPDAPEGPSGWLRLGRIEGVTGASTWGAEPVRVGLPMVISVDFFAHGWTSSRVLSITEVLDG